MITSRCPPVLGAFSTSLTMVVVLCSALVCSVLSLVAAQSISHPDCGTTVMTLVTHGEPIIQGEYPWLAALYKQDEHGKWNQFCGGALLSPRIVISAAHCLMYEGELREPENIKVGLGKLYRDFYHTEDNAIITNVTHVLVPNNYLASLSSFSLDVGLLRLEITVKLSDFVVPVCIDLDTITAVRTGATVHAAGWGTSENEISTEKALAARLSYLDYHRCLTRIKFAYRKYVTHDKFCSLSVNGSQVDRGDSGGALTYFKDGRHFIVGVVSTKITSQTTFSTFTDVSNSEIHGWLKKQIAYLNLPDYNEGYLFQTNYVFSSIEKLPVGTSRRLKKIPTAWETGDSTPAFDCLTRLMYFAGSKVIKEASIDATIDRKVKITGEQLYVGDSYIRHTVDWIGRKLYWVSGTKNNSSLRALNLNTKETEIIIPQMTTFAILPKVHPTLRKIYLISEDKRRLESVDLDSSTPSLTLFHKEENPTVFDIAIDWQTNELCWTHGNNNTGALKCKNLLTGAYRTIVSDLTAYSDGSFYIVWQLVITSHNYYWNDFLRIHRMSKSTYRVENITAIHPVFPVQAFTILPETCPKLIPVAS